MSEGFIIETDRHGEIKLPGEPVPDDEPLLEPITDAEAADFAAESEAIIEATRPLPGDADLRLGA